MKNVSTHLVSALLLWLAVGSVSARITQTDVINVALADETTTVARSTPEGLDAGKVEPTGPTKSMLRSTQDNNENYGKLLVYAEEKYDSNGYLTQRIVNSYDAQNRLKSTSTYIRNDYSQDWMYKYDGMICTYRMNRDLTRSGYITYNEVYSMDMSTGILKGTSKYYREFNDIPGIENFDLYYQDFAWNDTTSTWVEKNMYTCQYNYSGNNLSEEDFYWDWNPVAKTWTKNLNTKYTFQYLHQNNFWFTTENKSYFLNNGSYVCDYSYTAVPNIAAKAYYNTTTTTMVDNVLVNDSKIVYTYTSLTNRNALTETFRWKDNQWKLLNKSVFEYSLPDSICSQTNYRTADYYAYFGYTLPTLCSGQTLFPTSKYVTHPNNAVGQDVNYTYSWDKSNCRWYPNGAKTIFVMDPTGKYPLSQTYCGSYTTTDWTNCTQTNYTYYPNGKLKDKILITDGINNQQKSRYMYYQDTLLTQVKYYNSYDWNYDGSIDSTEWSSNGYTRYVLKYNLGFDSDSIQMNVPQPGSLGMFAIENVHKLKLTGTLSCEDLNYLSTLSQESLRSLDLSDASIQGDTLTEECFGVIGLNNLVLPNNLLAIGRRAIESYSDEYYDGEEMNTDYQLKRLVINPSLQYLANGGIQAVSIKELSVRSDLLNQVFLFSMDIPGIVDVYKSTLKHITFNDPSGKIQDAICYNMPYLESVAILDGVSEIGNNAFKSCGMLARISLPPSTLRKIGHNAFWGCNELTSLTIPEGTTSIDYSAFWGCSGLNFIQMPSTLTNIAQNAFWGCSSVGNMNVTATIPPTLGANALLGVPRTASLSVPPVGFEAYKQAPQWKEFYLVESGLPMEETKAIQLMSMDKQLQFRNVPENTTIRIFDVAGIKQIDMVNTASDFGVELQEGLYLVQIGDKRYKTVVRH
jgi:hypothetical protein